MPNTNEQEIDELLDEAFKQVLEDHGLTVNGITTIRLETKQCLLALMERTMESLIDEAKPEDKPYDRSSSDERFAGASAWNTATRRYNENLHQSLKAQLKGEQP